MKKHQILRQTFGTFVAASALMLTACSEETGWVAVEHKGAPYGEERTVGQGIKYVRAYMLPEKGPTLDPIMEEVDALIESHEQMSMPAEDVKSAEPMFAQKQRK